MRAPDWVRTLRQGLPRVPGIIGRLEPTFEVESIAALEPDFLRRHDVQGIIWDVDGTLMAYHGPRIATALSSAFAAIQATPTRHVILSNAGERRFRELQSIFPTIPIVGSPQLRKPSADLINRAIMELGCAREHVVMIGDQYLTDIAGANLGGVRSIKVATFARHSFPLLLRAFQRFEEVLYRILY